jgi:hypothetical protein
MLFKRTLRVFDGRAGCPAFDEMLERVWMLDGALV